jgi:hypothetical protein
MHADAHVYVGQTGTSILGIHCGHGQLHGHGTSHRPLGIILAPNGSTKDDQHRIANNLINRTLVLHDDLDHGTQIAIEHGHDLFRR